MLSREDFLSNNRLNKVFSISKDFSQRQAYINSLDRQNVSGKTAVGGKKSSKLPQQSSERLTKKQLDRKMKNRLSAIKSRSNVKRTIWSLEINNRELKQENHDLREALKLTKTSLLPSETSMLTEMESTDNDSSSINSSSKSFYSCRQCGFKNYFQSKPAQSSIQNSSLASDSETMNNFNSNVWFLNHKDLETEIKPHSINLIKEEQQEKLMISSTSSTTGSNLFGKIGFILGIICIIAVLTVKGGIQAEKIIQTGVSSPKRILQDITNIVSKKQATNEILKLLPTKEVEQSPATQIQRYISDEELENKVILKEKRDTFIKQVSNGTSKESCVAKHKYSAANSKLVVPYNLGNKRLTEEGRQLATIQETMTRSIGSIMLTDQTLIDDASLLSFQNIETHYASNNTNEDSGCFFLHMIIPNQVFEMNNYDFGSSAKNAFWEVGCKIFQFKRIDK